MAVGDGSTPRWALKNGGRKRAPRREARGRRRPATGERWRGGVTGEAFAPRSDSSQSRGRPPRGAKATVRCGSWCHSVCRGRRRPKPSDLSTRLADGFGAEVAYARVRDTPQELDPPLRQRLPNSTFRVYPRWEAPDRPVACKGIATGGGAQPAHIRRVTSYTIWQFSRKLSIGTRSLWPCTVRPSAGTFRPPEKP